ncbi:AI-2E family transporter [Paraflavisolibacter sp. H34]|uniref:AI-2E family transporter n=1 Tax=Huijunlia imazamoxiresistens TaxID=3127457 RepID=UPI003016554F
MEQKSDVNGHPFYIRITVVLFGLILFVYILDVLAAVLVPLAMAALIAILLNPLNNRLQRRLPRMVSILITMLLAFLAIGGMLYFLSSQIYMFSKSLPLLQQRFAILLADLQQWVLRHFGLSIESQVHVVKNAVNNSQRLLTNTLGTILGTLGIVVLIPVYVVLLLYYKPLILNFLFLVFLEKYSLRVAEILSQVKSAIQSYMIGLFTETVIVCVLYSIALLIIGVPYAIVIGVIGGILNILPYIGGLIAMLLSILAGTLNSTGFSTQLIIIASYVFIQLIDNNLLVPRIVSSKVQINALISLITILLGSALWGLFGMFLSIPFIAVLKIVFDRIDGLKPWGLLLGDEVPAEHIGVVWQKRWNRILHKLRTGRAKEK